ncbi:hypothetical protein [Methanofollis fontis]|uniref:Uncharacterized protein n=1 Tax=Methanofollis fontis TaxID=2052832 RepID=A0A483CRG7_9EURY|nr:hypothetical protein [Methanofollis fontis]TAJ43624.1 hypothetical protein CUJ86_09765 [Methanofollis fontis]
MNGSPRIESCANTGSERTATTTSVSGVLSASREVHAAELLPLYLVPPTIAANVKKFGGAISEIHVHRTKGHAYAVTVVTQEEASA